MRSPRLILLSALLLSAILPASAQAAFAGANGRIAFDRTLTTGVDQIFAVAPDGSTPVNLSNSSASDTTPSYSRDGKLIVFERDNGCCGGAGGVIMVMNADGSNQHQLTTPPSGEYDAQPAFSPDGQQIVFERGTIPDTGRTELLFVVKVDGTGLHQLQTPPAGFADETPRWSPDGTKIAFMREPTDDSGGQIMVVNANGTGTATPVSHPPSGYKDGDPNFSPDGLKIVFSRSQAADLNVASNIIVADVHTTAETPLTNDTASTIENEDPAFSPDGRLIVYGRADNTDPSNPIKQLYVMGADGSGKHAITPAVANQFDGVPDWQALAPTLSGLAITPGKASIAGRRVAGRCVKPTKNNKKHNPCRRSAKLTVRYTLNTASSVAFKLTRSLPGRKVKGKCVNQTTKNKKRKRCTLTMPVRISITGPGAAGGNSSMLDAKALGPGSYVLTATPSAVGLAGTAQSASFTIVS